MPIAALAFSPPLALFLVVLLILPLLCFLFAQFALAAKVSPADRFTDQHPELVPQLSPDSEDNATSPDSLLTQGLDDILSTLDSSRGSPAVPGKAQRFILPMVIAIGSIFVWVWVVTAFAAPGQPAAQLSTRLAQAIDSSTGPSTAAYDYTLMVDGTRFLAVSDGARCAATSFPLASGTSSFYFLDQPCSAQALTAASASSQPPLDPVIAIMWSLIIFLATLPLCFLVVGSPRHNFKRFSRDRIWPAALPYFEFGWFDDPTRDPISASLVFGRKAWVHEKYADRDSVLRPLPGDHPSTIRAVKQISQIVHPPMPSQFPWRTLLNHPWLAVGIVMTMVATLIVAYLALIGAASLGLLVLPLIGFLGIGPVLSVTIADDLYLQYAHTLLSMPEHLTQLATELCQPNDWRYTLWFATIHVTPSTRTTTTPTFTTLFSGVESVSDAARNALRHPPESASAEFKFAAATLSPLLDGAKDSPSTIRDLIATIETITAPDPIATSSP